MLRKSLKLLQEIPSKSVQNVREPLGYPQGIFKGPLGNSQESLRALRNAREQCDEIIMKLRVTRNHLAWPSEVHRTFIRNSSEIFQTDARDPSETVEKYFRGALGNPRESLRSPGDPQETSSKSTRSFQDIFNDRLGTLRDTLANLYYALENS